MNIADKLTTIAENEQKVYDKGVTDGRQAEYDEFWSEYLTPWYSGNFQYYFAGNGWDNTTFKPSKNIYVYTSAISMFRESKISGDLDAILKELGIKITFGKASVNNCFAFTYFTKLPHLGWSQITDINTAFYGNNHLTDISMDLPEYALGFNNTFYNAKVLANLTITSGKIMRSIDFSYSPLTPASMKSVINALENFSGTDNELKYTVTFKVDCWTALEADSTPVDEGIEYEGTWRDYVTNLGWLN